jgi:SAM-dependent methyltransferase
MMNKETSYRDSHKDKGGDYHSKFTENPRRALFWDIEQRFLTDVAQRFLPSGEVSHLDFACGTGRILAFFENYVQSSTGVDVSASMLGTAKTVVSKAKLVEADITSEPVFEGQHFDLITAFRFFPNAEPKLRGEVIEALFPLLRPGGILVFNNHRNTGWLAFRVKRMLTRARVTNFGMSADDVTKLVGSVGLTIEKTYHVGVVPELDTRLLRPRLLISWLEAGATHLPVAGLSQNLIYVCRKNA